MASKRNSAENVLKSLVIYDRSQWRWSAGLRNALGLAIPLMIGLLIGHVLPMVSMAVGALVTGFAAVSGTRRKRIRTIRMAIIWMGLATFVGTVSGHWLWILLPVVLVSGFGAGLAAAVGLDTMQIGILATTALIIFSAFPEPPRESGEQAILVMTGGLLQLVLVILFVRWEPRSEEEQSLETVFARLEDYIRQPNRTRDLNIALALLHAEEQLNDWDLRPQRWSRLKALLGAAESLRNDILAFMQTEPKNNEDVRAFNEICATALHHIRVHIRQPATHPYEESLTLPNPNDARLSHFLRSLQFALSLVSNSPIPTNILSKAPTTHRHHLWPRLHANLTGSSAAFRHGIRLAVTLSIALLLYRLLPLTRGYWVPLTILVVLRPDFQATFTRGLARVVGTFAGVLFATGLLILAAPDTQHLIGTTLVVLFAIALYAALNVNYALFSVFVTGEVVILLSFFEHASSMVTLHDRLEDTLIGSALALLAYVIWPTWQRKQIPLVLANWVADERRYLYALLTPGTSIESYRKNLRLSRTNAVATINQASAEPVKVGMDMIALGRFVTALHRLTEILLTLEFTLEQEVGSSSAKQQFVGQRSLWAQQLDLIENALRQPELDLKPTIEPAEPIDAKDYWDIVRVQLQTDLAILERALPLIFPDRHDSPEKTPHA